MWTATVLAGAAIDYTVTRTDLWELQQDVADYVGRQLDRWYEGRDWTGRKAVRDRLLDQAFSLGETVQQVGPLPDGVVITLAETEE
jgi:hypothetical protein